MVGIDEIELRPAVPTDVDAVADYHGRCFRKTFAVQLATREIIGPDVEDVRGQFRDWFEPGSEFDTCVVVAHGVPVAHVTVWRNQLVHLFVDPGYQGRGLGGSLLKQAEAACAAAGHAALELHVRVENRGAIRFYERHGWAMTDRLVATVEHGIRYDEHVMTKRLPVRDVQILPPARAERASFQVRARGEKA